jgi:hypothetical protein
MPSHAAGARAAKEISREALRATAIVYNLFSI